MKKISCVFICLIMLLLTFSACSNDVEIPTLEINNSTVSATSKIIDGEARFNVVAPSDGMYDFFVGEHNADEWTCNFYLLNENNEKVTGDININSTEWVKRSVFLTKGNYTLVAFGEHIKNKVDCSIDVITFYEDNEVVLTQDGEISAPALIGFNALNTQEKTVKFTLDGSQEKLVFDAYGSGTYYDSSQQFSLKITDKNGEIVLYDPDFALDEYIFEGSYYVDAAGLQGEYTAHIQANDSCVITIDIR